MNPDRPLQGANADRFCGSFLESLLRNDTSGTFVSDPASIVALQDGFVRRNIATSDTSQLWQSEKDERMEVSLRGRFSAARLVAALGRPNEAENAWESLTRMTGGMPNPI